MSIQKKRNEVSRLLRLSNRHRNVLRWSAGETEEHITMKFKICKTLKKWGHEFYTEAIFEPSGLRADVIDADTGVVYEVHNTEPKESLIQKALNYPLEVRFIDANVDFEEKMLL
tara:strand:+ start:289 stop:630 length:342 start_codon:yes stop_codon:yes gene_type:complete